MLALKYLFSQFILLFLNHLVLVIKECYVWLEFFDSFMLSLEFHFKSTVVFYSRCWSLDITLFDFFLYTHLSSFVFQSGSCCLVIFRIYVIFLLACFRRFGLVISYFQTCFEFFNLLLETGFLLWFGDDFLKELLNAKKSYLLNRSDFTRFFLKSSWNLG